jgi:hypothetical protein
MTTHHFTASHLTQKAAELEAQANHARALAEVFKTMPDPMSGHVVQLARAVQPFGLIVISADVLAVAEHALRSFREQDDEGGDYPRHRIDDALASIKQARFPHQIKGPIT